MFSDRLKKYLCSIMGTLMAVSAPICASAAMFYDTEAHWAEEVIEKWAERKVILGYDGCFNPDAPIIRGDFAVILNRVLTSSDEFIYENTFSDLEDDKYYTEAILRLNQRGVILGSDGMVYPENNITREEAFVMIGRAFEIKKAEYDIDFDDSDEVSDWALDIVCSLCAQGIVSGSGDNKINPGESITRAEVVQLLENVSNKLNLDEDSTGDNTGSTSGNTSGGSYTSGGSHSSGGSSGSSSSGKPSGGSSSGSGSGSSSGSSSGSENGSDSDNTSGGGLTNSDLSDIDKNIIEAGPIVW